MAFRRHLQMAQTTTPWRTCLVWMQTFLDGMRSSASGPVTWIRTPSRTWLVAMVKWPCGVRVQQNGSVPVQTSVLPGLKDQRGLLVPLE